MRTPTPVSSQVDIFINQGMNTATSTIAGLFLNGVVENININVRAQILEGFKSQGAKLTVEQASSLANPITKKVTNLERHSIVMTRMSWVMLDDISTGLLVESNGDRQFPCGRLPFQHNHKPS